MHTDTNRAYLMRLFGPMSNPTAAIHSFCRWCNDADPVSGWVDCRADTCPLFAFRPGPWQSDSPAAKPAAHRVIAVNQRRGTLGTRPRRPLFRAISCRGISCGPDRLQAVLAARSAFAGWRHDDDDGVCLPHSPRAAGRARDAGTVGAVGARPGSAA